MTEMSALELRFTITAFSGFRVGAAYGRDGVDSAVDLEDPLPATHLKGIMRASATELTALLGLPADLAVAVFGSSGSSAWWSWSGAVPPSDPGWLVTTRHRVEIDKESGAARKDHLVRAHRVDTTSSTFTIHRLHRTAGAGPAGVEAEQALLRLAARHTHHLGAWRRRGWGWVDIHADDETPGQVEADLDLLTRIPMVALP